MTKKTPHIGSSFEDFLAEEGLLEECTSAAMGRVASYQHVLGCGQRVMGENRQDGKRSGPAKGWRPPYEGLPTGVGTI